MKAALPAFICRPAFIFFLQLVCVRFFCLPKRNESIVIFRALSLVHFLDEQRKDSIRSHSRFGLVP
jgi:hypothetical protein